MPSAETSFGLNISQAMRLLRLLRLGRMLRLLFSDALDVATVGIKKAFGGARLIWFQFLQIIIIFTWVGASTPKPNAK